jgi:hypothetical protein
MDSFLESRYDFIAALSDQVSLSTGESLFDKKGTASRAALLGMPKSKIEEFLNKNRIFKMNKNLMEDSSLILDPFEKAQILKFKDFYETLVNMEDSEEKFNLRSEISSRLSAKYSDIDSALLEVEGGGDARAIFDALMDSPKWRENASDYVTKDYVDLPSKNQRMKWAKFKEIIDLINDLKYFQ